MKLPFIEVCGQASEQRTVKRAAFYIAKPSCRLAERAENAILRLT